MGEIIFSLGIIHHYIGIFAAIWQVLLLCVVLIELWCRPGRGGGYFRERHMTLHLTFRLLRQGTIKKIEFLQDAHNGEGNS